MAEKKVPTKKLSTSNTKQEMLDSYNDLVVQLEEKREANATPEQKMAEKVVKQAVAVADALTVDGIIRNISDLKAEIGKVLSTLSTSMEEESNRYESVKKAIIEKEHELSEIYEIKKAATSLSALIEAQNLKKEEFEIEMETRKVTLSCEIESTKSEWLKEKINRAAELKEQEAVETKKRIREKEEYDYALQKERQLVKDSFAKDKADFEEEKERLEREIKLRKELSDREFTERELAISRQEEELNALRATVTAFPKELESAVSREVKQAVDKVQTEAKFKLELLQKEFEGERNVLTGRVASLEAVVKEQSARVANLTEQVEKSYVQVQAIAVKAVEGSAAKPIVFSTPQQKQGES